MEIELKYGDGKIELQLPDQVEVSILEPQRHNPLSSVRQALCTALAQVEQPGKPYFIQHFQNDVTAAIAIPDESRALPTSEILSFLYDWVLASTPGLCPENITIIICSGLHSKGTMNEVGNLVPKHIGRVCRVTRHDAFTSEVMNCGSTYRGTPVWLNRAFAMADYKIVLGQIEPHQFAGFTDSVSALVIGGSSQATIEHNHSLIRHTASQIGRLYGNPVREDLDEAGRLARIDLAVDVVLTLGQEVAAVFAGTPADNLQQGAKVATELYGVGLDQKFDVVVAGCGGYRNDVSLYQAQKGFYLAAQAVKPGGHIFVITGLPQGDDNKLHFDYVSQFTNPDQVLSDFRNQEVSMAPSEACLLGRTFYSYNVANCSKLDRGVLKNCHLRAANPSQVIAEWIENYTDTKKIGVITDAGTTYFHN